MNVRGENFIMKVGIDLGGSHIAIGVVDENGRIIEKQERRILDKEKQEIKTFIEEYIIKNIKEMSKKYKITKYRNSNSRYSKQNICYKIS